LVFMFIFGYSGLVCQSLYEVFIGRAKIWGDVTAALIVLIYWDTVPFAYAHINSRLGIKSVLFGFPGKDRKGLSTTDTSSHDQYQSRDSKGGSKDSGNTSLPAVLNSSDPGLVSNSAREALHFPNRQDVDSNDRSLTTPSHHQLENSVSRETGVFLFDPKGQRIEGGSPDSSPFLPTPRAHTPLGTTLPLIAENGTPPSVYAGGKRFFADRPVESVEMGEATVRPIFNPFNSSTPEPPESLVENPTVNPIENEC